MRIFFIFSFLFYWLNGAAQPSDKLLKLQQSKNELLQRIKVIEQEIEQEKLRTIIEDLKSIGLPSTDYIEHSAMILSYDEQHEQAKWVSHIILPDIKTGTAYRTNDFRVDPKVKTGTSVEKDYFLKTMNADSSFTYDGFGYDRGHLAPSADFRWSSKALSQSYFYSNMTPQLPEFNREIWAELEAHLRDYVMNQNTALHVVTLPVLTDALPKMERAINSLSIPKEYIKVVYDPIGDAGIAFLIPNEKAREDLSYFAISIDQAEEKTGFNFFSNLKNDAFEKSFNKKRWFPELGLGNKEPIYAPSLPANHFNSKNAGRFAKSGKKISVCGHVVSTRYSRKGHLWLNLDKKFPNQIFSIFIRKKDLIHFDGDPKLIFENKSYCFNGKVKLLNEVPTMNIESQTKTKEFKVN